MSRPKTSALVILCLMVTFSVRSANESAARFTFTASEIALLQLFSAWPPQVPDDPGNELSGKTWAELLGEQLFHDPKLSDDKSLSCASCHQAGKGFTDGLPTALGREKHVRNTQGLLNVGYQRWFGWDGGADSLWAASLRPLLSEIEMNNSVESAAEYLRSAEYVVQALNSEGIKQTELTDEALLVIASKAMGAFQRTLVSERTSFDHFVDALGSHNTSGMNQYPDDAKQGLKLFFGEGNCHTCHFGANFSNGEFHDTGRPFFTGVGQVDPGRYTGIQRVRSDPFNLAGDFNGTNIEAQIQKTETVTLGQVNFGQWRTPGLRGLTGTAPYMHDGSLATLRDVVDSYADIDPARLHAQGESLLAPRDWSDQQREALVAFLESLSH